MEYSSHAPDLVPAEFYLFPRLKSALKGRRFFDATEIMEKAKEALKRLLKWFPRMFPTSLQ
jgi:hypothetical protein